MNDDKNKPEDEPEPVDKSEEEEKDNGHPPGPPPTPEETDDLLKEAKLIADREFQEQISKMVFSVITGFKENIDEIKTAFREHGSVVDLKVEGQYKGLNVTANFRTFSTEVEFVLKEAVKILKPPST